MSSEGTAIALKDLKGKASRNRPPREEIINVEESSAAIDTTVNGLSRTGTAKGKKFAYSSNDRPIDHIPIEALLSKEPSHPTYLHVMDEEERGHHVTTTTSTATAPSTHDTSEQVSPFIYLPTMYLYS
jgi:hypothetical protein